MNIKQISVFVENKPGALYALSLIHISPRLKFHFPSCPRKGLWLSRAERVLPLQGPGVAGRLIRLSPWGRRTEVVPRERPPVL